MSAGDPSQSHAVHGGAAGRTPDRWLRRRADYHAYHALDSHIIGFTLWEVGPRSRTTSSRTWSRFFREFADDHPYLMEHAEQDMAGFGREGQGEFVFVPDLILDCLERARAAA